MLEYKVLNNTDNQIVTNSFVLNKMRQIAGTSPRSFRSGYE